MPYIFRDSRMVLYFAVALATSCGKNAGFSHNENGLATTECLATFLSPSIASEGEHSVAVAGELEVNLAKQTLRVGDVVSNFFICQSSILDICIASHTPLGVASEPGEDTITINGRTYNITSNLSKHEISRKIITTKMESDEITVTTIYSQNDGVLAIYDELGKMYIVEGRLDRSILEQCIQKA